MGNLNLPLRSAPAHFWNKDQSGVFQSLRVTSASTGGQKSTSTVASEMASCLYDVPYHSSVLSVCPSNDLDTTATLDTNKSEAASCHDQKHVRIGASQVFSDCKLSGAELA